MEAYKIAINGDNEVKLWVDPCSLLRSGETAIQSTLESGH